MQQHSESPLSFGNSEPSIGRGAVMRAARALAARFTLGAADDPVEQPFRDSDFEAEPDFFGRPLGEH